ncbi:MAG: PQQ-binding-like beta-propeller repeat protein [Candidatus Kapaibacterium sp.]
MRQIIYIFLLISIASCVSNEDRQGKPVNMYGGPGRHNAFEYADFYRELIYVETPDEFKNDNGINEETGAVVPPLTLTGDDVIIATDDGRLVKVAFEHLLWEAQLDSGEVAASAMCADPGHNIYLISNKGSLYSFLPHGELRWKKMIFPDPGQYEIFSDLLALNDGIYAASSEGRLKKIDFDGNIKWERESSFGITEVFAADDKGNLIINYTQNKFGVNDSLIYMDSNGHVIWARQLDMIRLIKTPVYRHGTIYVSGLIEIGERRLSSVIAFDTEGNEKWKIELNIVPRFLAVNDKQELFVSGYNAGIGQAMSGIFKFDTAGSLDWKMYYDAAIPSPPVIDQSSLAFPASTPEGIVMLFVRQSDGTISKDFTMTEYPAFNLQPSVSDHGIIVFAATGELTLLRFYQPPFNRYIPW